MRTEPACDEVVQCLAAAARRARTARGGVRAPRGKRARALTGKSPLRRSAGGLRGTTSRPDAVIRYCLSAAGSAGRRRGESGRAATRAATCFAVEGREGRAPLQGEPVSLLGLDDPAHGVTCLEQQHGLAALATPPGRGESAQPAPNDDGVEGGLSRSCLCRRGRTVGLRRLHERRDVIWWASA